MTLRYLGLTIGETGRQLVSGAYAVAITIVMLGLILWVFTLTH